MFLQGKYSHISRYLLASYKFCSDLVGFQTKEHQNNFVECCRRILGITAATEYGIPFNNRVVRIGAFPIGIDPDQFRSALKTDAVRKEIKSLKKNFKGRKVIVGVERLDYIKGIPQKLLAFERFLQQNPEWYSILAFE